LAKVHLLLLRIIGFTSLTFCFMALSSCNRKAPIPIVQMGERAEVGRYVYTVLEARWKEKLEFEDAERLPRSRFLLLRLSVTNGGAGNFYIPQLSLVSASGEERAELNDVTGVPDWLGVVRNVAPLETKTGWVLFDAPVGDYRLRVADDAFDPSDALTALIEVPVRLTANSDFLPETRAIQ
jgi:hypothetical protein